MLHLLQRGREHERWKSATGRALILEAQNRSRSNLVITKKQTTRLARLSNAEHALDSMAYSTPKRAIRLYRRRDTVVFNNEEALDRGPTYVSIVLSEVYCEVT